MIIIGALKGTGDTKEPFRINFLINLLVRLPLMYYIIFILQLEGYYIWGVVTTQYAAGALFLFLHYRCNKWDQLEIIPTKGNVG